MTCIDKLLFPLQPHARTFEDCDFSSPVPQEHLICGECGDALDGAELPVDMPVATSVLRTRDERTISLLL